jgi:hypothetical protein
MPPPRGAHIRSNCLEPGYRHAWLYRGSANEMTGGLRSVARMSCAEFAGLLDPYVPGDVPSTKNIYFMPTTAILRAVFIHFSLHLEQRLQPGWECSEGSLTLTTLWTSNTEEKYMGRTAMDWGSAAAHNLAAYSQSELGFATHFNMYLEV